MGRRRSASSVKMSESRVRSQLDAYPLSEPCPECGKLRYLTRKAARSARKRTGASGSMSVYMCGDYWHIGHTPWQIKTGRAQRSNMTNDFTPRTKK